MPHAFVRPDMAEGSLWLETPQTEAAMRALFTLLDLARSDDPGWQPFWILCGPEGAGKTALATRFTAQAQRSSACDAVRAAEERYAAEMRTPKIPSPASFERQDQAWAAYRAFAAMSPAERVARFGHCPHVCRPAEFLPELEFRAAIEYARAAKPVGFNTLRPKIGPIHDVVSGGIWHSRGNREHDPIRRTALYFLDGADHLTRLSTRKRGDVLAELRDWPRLMKVDHPVIFVLIGRPVLADAVAEIGAVRTIDLPAMANEQSDGTFAQVCRLVFGTRDPDEVGRLHRATGGAVGPLLTLARLRGLEPPFNIPTGDILRLPAPGQR